MITRRSGPLIAAVAALLGIGAGIVGLLLFVSAEEDARTRAEIDADHATIVVADTILPVLAAVTQLEKQSAAGSRFIAIDPVDGARIGGNLTAWPKGTPDARGWLRVDGGPDGPMIGRVARLDGQFPVFVGRSTVRMRALRDWALIGFGTALLLMLGGVFLFERMRYERQRRRLLRFDDTLSRFARGDENARIDDPEPDLLGGTAAQIDGALVRLKGIARANNALARTVAHEMLRTADLATGSVRKAATVADAVDGMDAAMADLRRVATGVLESNQPRSEPVAMELLDLATLVAEAAEPFDEAAQELGQTLRFDLAPAPVLGDRGQLASVVRNLVENAVKYSPEDGAIEVRTFVERNESVLAVIDQGAGPAGLPANLGDPLTRGPDVGDAEGYGLGLHYVATVAERHGARLLFREGPGGCGLRVECRLPRHEAARG